MKRLGARWLLTRCALLLLLLPQPPSPPQPDPFLVYITNNLGPHKVLAYRLLDDTVFKGVQPVTDTQAYVLWMADGTAIFAFRGTESACKCRGGEGAELDSDEKPAHASGVLMMV